MTETDYHTAGSTVLETLQHRCFFYVLVFKNCGELVDFPNLPNLSLEASNYCVNLTQFYGLAIPLQWVLHEELFSVNFVCVHISST